MTNKIQPGDISAGTVYGFEIHRAAFGLPPRLPEEREAEIARVTAEAEEQRRLKRETALASPRTTVAALIRQLSAYPPDMPVMTPGFDESGVDDITIKGLIKVRLGTGYSSVSEHEEAREGEPYDVEALLLNF